jgi:hypothetical protein
MRLPITIEGVKAGFKKEMIVLTDSRLKKQPERVAGDSIYSLNTQMFLRALIGSKASTYHQKTNEKPKHRTGEMAHRESTHIENSYISSGGVLSYHSGMPNTHMMPL